MEGPRQIVLDGRVGREEGSNVDWMQAEGELVGSEGAAFRVGPLRLADLSGKLLGQDLPDGRRSAERLERLFEASFQQAGKAGARVGHGADYSLDEQRMPWRI